MTLMQIRELIFCPHHNRGFIVLEDAERRLTLAFDVHPDEVPRLARLLKGSRNFVHPLHGFIKSLLDALLTTPTDVVLDDFPERGFMAFIHVQRAGTIMSVPCYAPDALALAAQMKTPIYATTRAPAHAEARSPLRNVLAVGEGLQAWLARVRPTDFHA
jgi:bifunctional DNase/RNase